MTDPDELPSVPEVEPEAPPIHRHRSRWWLPAMAGLLAGLSVGIGIGMEIGRSDGEDTAVSADDAAVVALEVADDETVFEVAKDECAAISSFVTVMDEGRGLSIRGEGKESGGIPVSDVVCLLVAVDVPDVVVSRISSTRALDGMQEASWGDIEAWWNYHPDSGLNIMLELQDD